jgi:hypothetical protein
MTIKIALPLAIFVCFFRISLEPNVRESQPMRFWNPLCKTLTMTPSGHSRTSGFVDIREKQTNSTSSISLMLVNYVPKLHVGLVGFVSLEMAARVQLDRSN